MIVKIAWRNIWRNKIRSAVVLFAIALGIWAIIFMHGFMISFQDGYVKNAISNDISHIQVHHTKYVEDKEVEYTLPHDVLLKTIDTSSLVKAYAKRTVVSGMIMSPRQTAGVTIFGIDPDMESKLTALDSSLLEGKYFDDKSKMRVLIGHKLADKLKVKIRSKVVLTFQDKENNITSGAFRVAGILKGNSLKMNELNAYVMREDVNALLGIRDEFHEVAMLLNRQEDILEFQKRLSSLNDQVVVENWRQLAPELEYIVEMSSASLFILQFIIMIALIFGIINTMLMSVLERFKELGILMAIGMNRKKVFMMIMLETLMLAITATPIGFIISWLTIHFLGTYGLDLSAYSEGLSQWGYDNVLYPHVDAMSYVNVIFGVFITSIVGAIYPALKAIRLKPVEAIHKI